MKKQLPAWLALCIIALAAGLLLGVTNGATAEQIEEQTRMAADAARKSVLPQAMAFVEQPAGEGVDNCYLGSANDAPVGFTAQVTAKGYGGPIEVTVGVSVDGIVTGVSVGGPKFSETAGLGAKAKEPAFYEQFAGLTPPAMKGGNVDAITGATITTEAVIGAVNTAVEFINAQMLPTAAQ